MDRSFEGCKDAVIVDKVKIGGGIRFAVSRSETGFLFSFSKSFSLFAGCIFGFSCLLFRLLSLLF